MNNEREGKSLVTLEIGEPILDKVPECPLVNRVEFNSQYVFAAYALTFWASIYCVPPGILHKYFNNR